MTWQQQAEAVIRQIADHASVVRAADMVAVIALVNPIGTVRTPAAHLSLHCSQTPTSIATVGSSQA